MICYSRTIVDYWRNRITEERKQKAGLGGMWEREETMVLEDSDSRTPPPAAVLTRYLGLDHTHCEVNRYACIYGMYLTARTHPLSQ